MKLRKSFLFLLILLASFQIDFGQEKPILVDQFGRLSNDPLLARIDSFSQAVIAAENSKGYIINYGTEKDQLAKYINERRIRGCLRWMKYPEDKFIFALGADKNELRTELWKVASDKEKPLFDEIKRDYSLSKLIEPRLVYQSSWVDEYCPVSFDMEFYSRFLKANSNLTGKIVIRERTLKKYLKEKRKYFRELTKTENVSSRQIKFVRGKYRGEPDTEFWFVPQKKK